MMTMQEMKDKIVKSNGMEDPRTLYFFKCCEEDPIEDTVDLLILEAVFWFCYDGE